jgi:hypothetical protein
MTIDATVLLIALLGALMANAIELPITYLIVRRLVKQGLRSNLGPSMLEWMFTETPTGNKIVEKYEGKDGAVKEREVPEVKSPAEILATNMGHTIWNMIKSGQLSDGRKRATIIADLQNGLADPDNPMAQAVGMVNPKLIERALKDGDYAPLIFQMLFSNPDTIKWIQAKLKSVGQRSTTGDSAMQKW